MEAAQHWWDLPIYGGTPRDWLIALGLSVAVALAVYLLKPMLVRRLTASSQRTSTQLDDAFVRALDATRIWLIAVFALSIGSQYLQLPEQQAKALAVVTSLAVVLQIGFWASSVFRFWIDRSRARALTTNASAATSLSAIGLLGQLVLWSVIVLVALDNMGINVTALVAGLGVGGVAVALAVQNILGDLFASLSIVVDKPFVIGDFIIVDNYMGTVENVGLKTTRIRSLDGELIVFSNGDLLKSRLRNYKSQAQRRVVFNFSVVYETSPDQLERIPPIVRKAIEEHGDKVRFDRAHFQKFTDHALAFEVVYWVQDPDFNLYMDIQQAVNLSILRGLADEQIYFAIPRQTVRVDGPVRIHSINNGGGNENGDRGTGERLARAENGERRESPH